jgi:hypothetical protein
MWLKFPPSFCEAFAAPHRRIPTAFFSKVDEGGSEKEIALLRYNMLRASYGEVAGLIDIYMPVPRHILFLNPRYLYPWCLAKNAI